MGLPRTEEVRGGTEPTVRLSGSKRCAPIEGDTDEDWLSGRISVGRGNRFIAG